MQLTVFDKTISPDSPCYFIAEAGLNHNGDFNTALEMIDVAAKCGIDAIKFQKRTTDKIMTAKALDTPYVGPNSFGRTYREHRDKLELDADQWKTLMSHSQAHGIVCFASVWDEDSADLMESLDAPAYKLASADLTNLGLLRHVAKKNKAVILSTGMSTIEEIDDAVNAVLPLNSNLAVLHCVSAYPFEAELANLKMIQTLAERYPEVVIGYSGHEKSGMVVSLGAAVLGAKIIERHFTLDRTMKGPDHAASLEPNGFRGLIEATRIIEQAIGDGVKRIYDEELPTRHKLAKSVTARIPIKARDVITPDMLMMRSPGTGLSGKHIESLIGKVAQTDIAADQLIPIDAPNWPLASEVAGQLSKYKAS